MRKNNNRVFYREAEVEAPSRGIVTKLITSAKTVFNSLKYRDYFYLWLGGWFSNVGTWIQNIALGWLVYDLTRSSLALGVVNFSSSIPVFFLSFYAGVVSDRVSRKAIVFWSNFFPMLFAFALGALVSTGAVNIYWIVALSLLSGIAFTFAFPSWQAIISQIVPAKDLMNAIALNSVQFHASRMLGPAVAGYLVAEYGTDWAFYINGATFLAVLVAVLLISPIPPAQAEAGKRSWLKEALEGFRYVRKNTAVLYYLLTVALVGVFGISFYSVLMPVFAEEIHGRGATGFGVLMSASGMGSLFGALMVAWLSGRVAPQKLLQLTVPAVGVSLCAFSLVKNYYLALFFIFLAGFFFLATNSTLNTAIQLIIDNRYRGRVMSLFVWMFMGLSPFGSLMSGYLGHTLSAPAAVFAGGIIIVICGAFLLFKIRNIKTSYKSTKI